MMNVTVKNGFPKNGIAYELYEEYDPALRLFASSVKFNRALSWIVEATRSVKSITFLGTVETVLSDVFKTRLCGLSF